MDRLRSYSSGEGRTALGMVVNFTHPSDVTTEEVADFLQANVRSIEIPSTHQVNVARGSYGYYSRYNIVQHNYAGAGHPGCGAYIELLEIKDAPNGRCGFVINEHRSDDRRVHAHFTEWESLGLAQNAYTISLGMGERAKKYPTMPGFKRLVNCGLLTPWFYAIGDEEIVGDHAFPEGLQDDPVYRFGRQFVVFKDDMPVVKTCMGCRVVNSKAREHPYREFTYRLIVWDDGTTWHEGQEWRGNRLEDPPRPLEEGEEWITEAVQQFKCLLAGKSTSFTINFLDGSKFVGRVVEPKGSRSSPEGDYYAEVSIKGSEEISKGWVFGFVPTTETPNIVQHIVQKLKTVDKVVIVRSKLRKAGRKWRGVFYGR